MLKIVVPQQQFFNEATLEFSYIGKEQTLILEHSLLSVAKWESKWKKPFLGKGEKTSEEVLDYIRCMTTNNVDPEVYNRLTTENLKSIMEYIEDPMTATTINERDMKRNREIITSEIIYYWMIALQIPVEFQKWHLNRLLTLINVCSIKNAPPKKMSKGELAKRNTALNEARRKKLNTNG